MLHLRPGLSLLFALLIACIAHAESAPPGGLPSAADPGALSPALIDELRNGFKMDAQTRVLYNAVTNNSIDDLALNRDIVRGEDGHFSHKITMKGITDQKNTGRCWLFAGLNTMRQKVVQEQGLPDFEFSTAYLQFWDKMEKANLFLEYMIEMRDTDYLDREWELVHVWTLDDGGWWSFAVDLIEKYGVVPKDVMPETKSSEDTTAMNFVYNRLVHVHTVKLHAMHRAGKKIADLREYKRKALAEVYRFLVINLGEPPREFQWRYETEEEQFFDDVAPAKEDKPVDNKTEKKSDKKDEKPAAGGSEPKPDGLPEVHPQLDSRNKKLSPLRTYTPQSFYKEYVDVPLRDYVCLYNDVTSPYRKHYQFSRARNMAGATDMDFVNLPADTLKTVTMASIMNGEPVWFAADMGKDQSSTMGLMADKLFDYGPLFGLDLTMSRADRIKHRAEISDHAMVFMGVDVRNTKPHKWLVENSWGQEHGKEGTWTLYDKWFDEHVFVIIVNKQFGPADVMKVFEEKPTVHPAWYPGAPGVRR